jgi:hypothetical protein
MCPMHHTKRPVLRDAVVFSGNHNRETQDFRLEDIKMIKKWFLQKKTAPPTYGGALLNEGIITPIGGIASIFYNL